MIKKGLLVIILIVTLLFCSCKGAGNSNATGGGATLPNYDEYAEELGINIMGWVTPSTINSEQLGYVTEAGVDTLFYMFNTYSPTQTEFDALELCEGHGVNVYITPGTKDGSAICNIEKFNEYDSVVGITYDEPNKKEITSIMDSLGGFNSASIGKTLFVNLYPSFASAINEFDNYEGYLKLYCDNVLEGLTVGEKWLSADRYPLTYNGKGEKSLDTGWLRDIEAVATVAREYEGVKTNFFIQTMPYGDDAGKVGSRDRIPTYEDILMQEYTIMSFGYDAISLFCYGTPAVGPEFREDQVAMIDRSGNRTDLYYAAQRANKEILAFDHVLKQFDWKGVFTNDAGKTTASKDRTSNSSFSNLVNRMSLEQVSFINEVYSSEDTLFGYFMDGEDNEAVMVVNYNETTLCKTDEVKIKFNAEYKYNKCLCYVGGEKKIFDVTNNTLTLNLGVGEGVFVVPYRQ